MKFQYGLVIVIGFLIASTLVLIYNQPNEIPKWQTLHHTQLQDDHGNNCDEECKSQHIKRNFSCTEITQGDYVCRPPREIRFPEHEYPIPIAYPPNYGEFAYFPDGVKLVEMRLFDIAKVDLINTETKEIQIEFGFHHLNQPENDFTYFATLYPGETFVSHCTGSNLKTGHLVEYIDVFELDDTTYIEFWGAHIIMPDNLLPCELPELIEQSLAMDLSLEIEFEMPKSKPSQWDFRTIPSYVIIPKGSASPNNEFHLIPKDIVVVLGQNNTVTWINEDDTPSTLVSSHLPAWSTGLLLPGESASITFNETGIYKYHGSPHPWKVGTIIVLVD